MRLAYSSLAVLGGTSWSRQGGDDILSGHVLAQEKQTNWSTVHYPLNSNQLFSKYHTKGTKLLGPIHTGREKLISFCKSLVVCVLCDQGEAQTSKNTVWRNQLKKQIRIKHPKGPGKQWNCPRLSSKTPTYQNLNSLESGAVRVISLCMWPVKKAGRFLFAALSSGAPVDIGGSAVLSGDGISFCLDLLISS